MFVKAFTLLLALAAVTGLPTDPYGHHHNQYKPEPKPYKFAYGIQDPHYGPNFSQKESSDGKVVKGSYTVQLPDGRKQTVTYISDHYNGFQADVQYYGDAKFPPPSKHIPFTVKPSHYAPPHKPSYHEPSHYKPSHHKPSYHEPSYH